MSLEREPHHLSRTPEKLPHTPEFAVVGAGIIGLTTAYKLALASNRENGVKLNIHVYTTLPPDKTTSAMAGASVKPHASEFNDLTRLGLMDAQAWYGQIMNDPRNAGRDTGVRYAKHIESSHKPIKGNEKSYLPYMDNVQLKPFNEIPEMPDYEYGISYDTYQIDPETHLEWLAGKLNDMNVPITILDKPFESLEEMSMLEADAIFNCTGLGSRKWDEAMYPIAGHVVLVEPVENMRYSYSVKTDRRGRFQGNRYAYLVDRKKHGILGGSAQVGEEPVEPDPEVADDIYDVNRKTLPDNVDLKRVRNVVAIRPGRKHGPNVSAQHMPNGKFIIHNYGHGGSGFTYLGTVNTAISIAARELNLDGQVFSHTR